MNNDEALAFADLTTLKVGGAAERLITATTQRELVDAALEAWGDLERPWLTLGGGSNLLVADAGFPGTAIRIATRGIEQLPMADGDVVRIRVQAGEPWDALVAYTIDRGWSGLEALSGIPGLVGAAPVQNIGAYGQELSSTLVAIDFLEYGTDHVRRIPASELELGYRTSVLKQGLTGVVVAVELDLHDTATERAVLGEPLSKPVAYDQLARALGVDLGDRVAIGRVRDAVLKLRRAKGMVLDADDPDSVSAGSFFTNPIVSERFVRTLPPETPRWYLEPEQPDEVIPLTPGATETPLDAFLAHQAERDAAPQPRTAPEETSVKISAAWLIEHAGIHRGFALPGSRAAVSSKHTLALTNRGGATAEEIAQLARYVRDRVQSDFGILLQPEPVLVGIEF